MVGCTTPTSSFTTSPRAGHRSPASSTPWPSTVTGLGRRPDDQARAKMRHVWAFLMVFMLAAPACTSSGSPSACRASDLRPTRPEFDGGLGSYTWWITVRNGASGTCVVSGFPEVELSTTAGRSLHVAPHDGEPFFLSQAPRI